MTQKNFKDIKIIESRYPGTLELEINRLIEDGFQPLDLSVLNQKHINSDTTRIVMVRYNEEDNEI